MEKIAIVTDSSCDLSKEYLQEHGIRTIPLHIIFSDGEYKDGIDISAEEVVARFEQEIPSTSMPVPADVQKIFDELKQENIKKVLFVLISSKLSGTLAMVQLMCEMQSDIEYEIVDSRILTIAEGYLIEEAVRLRKEGLPLGQYNEKLQQLRDELFGYFAIPTLEYLKKGGRINTVGAAVGNLLHICPVVFVSEEGVYVPAAIARGYKKAISKMVDICQEKIKGYKFDLGFVHCGAENICKEIAEKFKNIKGCDKIIIRCVSPALSVHVGVGLVGMVVKRKGLI